MSSHRYELSPPTSSACKKHDDIHLHACILSEASSQAAKAASKPINGRMIRKQPMNERTETEGGTLPRGLQEVGGARGEIRVRAGGRVPRVVPADDHQRVSQLGARARSHRVHSSPFHTFTPAVIYTHESRLVSPSPSSLFQAPMYGSHNRSTLSETKPPLTSNVPPTLSQPVSDRVEHVYITCISRAYHVQIT